MRTYVSKIKNMYRLFRAVSILSFAVFFIANPQAEGKESRKKEEYYSQKILQAEIENIKYQLEEKEKKCEELQKLIQDKERKEGAIALPKTGKRVQLREQETIQKNEDLVLQQKEQIDFLKEELDKEKKYQRRQAAKLKKVLERKFIDKINNLKDQLKTLQDLADKEKKQKDQEFAAQRDKYKEEFSAQGEIVKNLKETLERLKEAMNKELDIAKGKEKKLLEFDVQIKEKDLRIKTLEDNLQLLKESRSKIEEELGLESNSAKKKEEKIAEFDEQITQKDFRIKELEDSIQKLKGYLDQYKEELEKKAIVVKQKDDQLSLLVDKIAQYDEKQMKGKTIELFDLKKIDVLENENKQLKEEFAQLKQDFKGREEYLLGKIDQQRTSKVKAQKEKRVDTVSSSIILEKKIQSLERKYDKHMQIMERRYLKEIDKAREQLSRVTDRLREQIKENEELRIELNSKN
ncbi:MAG: hypothetical protein ABII75_02990 [Candidatus Omnitrophota bacterium]